MLDYDPTRRITLAEALRHRFIEPEYEKYLEERRQTRKIEDDLKELIYPSKSKSNSRDKYDERDRRGTNGNYAPNLSEITKSIKGRSSGGGKTYLDRLLEEDAMNSKGNSGGNVHVSSGNNKIYEEGIKMCE